MLMEENLKSKRMAIELSTVMIKFCIPIFQFKYSIISKRKLSSDDVIICISSGGFFDRTKKYSTDFLVH